MGNTESSAQCEDMYQIQDQLRATFGESWAPDASSIPTFAVKADYIDPSLQALLPPTSSSIGSSPTAPQQGPHVTCLMTNATAANGVVGTSRSVLERAAHILRTSTHAGLVRCVVSKENNTRQFTMITAPQIEWLVPPPHSKRPRSLSSSGTPGTTPLSGGGLTPSPSSIGALPDCLDRWTVSEVLFGVAGIVDACSVLLSTHDQGCLQSLRLHQVSTALHHGSSASHISPSPSTGGTTPSSSYPWLDASVVQAGRWVIHDLTTFEPMCSNGKAAGGGAGHSLTAVGLFLLEVLGRVAQRSSMRLELLAIVRRAVAEHDATAQSRDGRPTGGAMSEDEDESVARQPSCGSLTPPAVAACLESEFSADDQTNQDLIRHHSSGDVLGEPTSPASYPQPNSSSMRTCSSALLGMRQVESMFSLLMDDLRGVLGRRSPATNSQAPGDHDGGSEAQGGDTSASPSRQGSTPSFHSGQTRVPTFVSTHAPNGGSGGGPAITRVLQWLHYVLVEVPFHTNGTLLTGSDAVRLLQELRDVILIDIKDPVCTLLRHGQQMYLYDSEDEHHRIGAGIVSSPTSGGGGGGGGGRATLKLDAYDEMRWAAHAIQRDYQPSTTNGPSNGSITTPDGILADNNNNTSFTQRSGNPPPLFSQQSTVWERRMIRWILHPCHVAQTESKRLLDFLFSTVGSPTALVSSSQLEHVALQWLVEGRNPACRAAALRFGSLLFPMLPAPQLGALLTTSGFIFMQGRICIDRLGSVTDTKSANAPPKPLTSSACIMGLNCVRAYVEAAPVLIAELMCSANMQTPTDRTTNRLLIQHVLLKELALLFRSCALADESIITSGFGNKSYQSISKLLRQTLMTLAHTAVPCFERIAIKGHLATHADVLPSAIVLLASCGFGTYYGTNESRERVISLIGSLLIQEGGGGDGLVHTHAQLPVAPVHIVKWWLPMMTPLCGASDPQLRAAACNLSRRLVHILSSTAPPVTPAAPPTASSVATDSADAADDSPDSTNDSDVSEGDEAPSTTSPQRKARPSPPCIATFTDLYRTFDNDLQESHREDKLPPAVAQGGLLCDALQQRYTHQYHKVTYVPYFVEAQAARQSSDHHHQSAPHASCSGAPTKDFLTSDAGRKAMWYCLGGRVDQDDLLLPQPHY